MIRSCPAMVITATLLVAGCQSHIEHPESGASVVSVVSTSAPNPGMDTERQEVLRRFTHDIWPAVVAYNGEGPSQGGPGYKRWVSITSQGMDTNAWNSLRNAVQHLGVVRDGDDKQGPVMASGALQAADTQVTALDPQNATVRVCYTYTAVSYPSDVAHPQYAPAASEADFHLRKTDNWYLHSITNDHVVPGCPSSKA